MRHAPGVKMTLAGNGAILLDTRAGRLFDLNRTAALVWSALENQPASSVLEIVQTQFPHIAADVIAADVAACVADFTARRLVVD